VPSAPLLEKKAAAIDQSGSTLSIERVSMRYTPPSAWLRPIVRVASRKPHESLSDVSLSVNAGEVVGLVGANGAGKTTLVKVVAGLLDPTSGRVTIGRFALDTHSREARRSLGVVLADDRGLYWRLTARQNLEFFGVLAGLPRAAAQARASEVLEWARLPDDDRLVFGYSSGMKTRLSLARALLPYPALLILDEPTRSLDPVAGARLWAQLRELADVGAAILVCSHDLEAVAVQCDRAAVLVAGRVRHVGPVKALARRRDARAGALVDLLRSDA
jgi:ABC-2 type transport system ATP-binding protein